MNSAYTSRWLAALTADAVPSAPECAAESDAVWDDELARRVFHEPGNFMALYEKFYDRILNYLYRRTMNLEDAEDLTSRTFLQAFESLRSREQRVHFKPWLYQIATNAHVTQVRKICRFTKRMADVAKLRFMSPPRNPAEVVSDEADGETLRAALLSLPEKYRIPLILRYDEGLSYNDIAAILGLEPTSARTRVARGLRLLEHALPPELKKQ